PGGQFGFHRASDRTALGGEGIEVDLGLERPLEPGAPSRQPRAKLWAERKFGRIERCAVMIPDAGCAIIGMRCKYRRRRVDMLCSYHRVSPAVNLPYDKRRYHTQDSGQEGCE